MTRKMAAPTGNSVAGISRRLAEMYITRFPFISALLFAMLSSEREQAGKPETLPRFLTYIQFAVQFLSATMMAFGGQKSLFALMAAVQTAVTSFVIHTYSTVQLDQWIVLRMVSRDAAIIGAFLIIASRVHEKLPKRYRLAYLYPLGCSFVGLFYAAYSIQLFREAQETKAFMRLMPFANIIHPIYCVYFLLAGLTLASDTPKYMFKAAKGLIPLTFSVLVFIELDFSYWTTQTNMEYWNHVDQMARMVTALGTVVLISIGSDTTAQITPSTSKSTSAPSPKDKDQ